MSYEPPGISVILVTDRWATIREVVHCLRAQTVREQIELIVVAPTGAELNPPQSDLEGFGGVQVIGIGSIDELAVARSVGVRAAHAPVVVLGETHAFPHPGWAEALIKAHGVEWGAVAPAFGNANPRGALSWAIFLLDYGRWIAGLPAGEIPFAPTHNGAYRRNVLLGLGADMETVLRHGDRLALYLKRCGHLSYFEPAARIDHLNISQPRAWLHERFLFGTLIAGRRAATWPLRRRLVYIAGSPLIPVLILYRLRRSVSLLRRQGELPPGTLAALLLGAVVSTIGEVVGYALGVGRASELRMEEYEMHKVLYADQSASQYPSGITASQNL